ncbi:unnamed protein product [Arabidopsis thaliana]|uniref:Uncharacterized protein n=1 Tax=Arabidopsis thaliana TaxID=3702 RepID=A0A5S9Y7F7_ARATH|nr:unnamed protein product [Arabidopsis thaliana]
MVEAARHYDLGSKEWGLPLLPQPCIILSFAHRVLSCTICHGSFGYICEAQVYVLSLCVRPTTKCVWIP